MLDFVWLVIPAAVGIFALRALMIARRLRSTAQAATEADARALREAKSGLGAHREHLEDAKTAAKSHLAAAKDLPRVAMARDRPATGLDAMVEDFLPERRF